MAAGQWQMQIQVVEQLAGNPGVFGGDQSYLTQDSDRPAGQILQISDGCADDI
jgi:hypothetical protein